MSSLAGCRRPALLACGPPRPRRRARGARHLRRRQGASLAWVASVNFNSEPRLAVEAAEPDSEHRDLRAESTSAIAAWFRTCCWSAGVHHLSAWNRPFQETSVMVTVRRSSVQFLTSTVTDISNQHYPPGPFLYQNHLWGLLRKCIQLEKPSSPPF